MISDRQVERLATFGPVAVGAVLILTGVSVAGLGLARPAGQPFTLDADALAWLAPALVLVLAGLEAVRRRHFTLVVGTLVLLTLADLGYGIAQHQPGSVMAGVFLLLAACAIAISKPTFRRRARPSPLVPWAGAHALVHAALLPRRPAEQLDRPLCSIGQVHDDRLRLP